MPNCGNKRARSRLIFGMHEPSEYQSISDELCVLAYFSWKSPKDSFGAPGTSVPDPLRARPVIRIAKAAVERIRSCDVCRVNKQLLGAYLTWQRKKSYPLIAANVWISYCDRTDPSLTKAAKQPLDVII